MPLYLDVCIFPWILKFTASISLPRFCMLLQQRLLDFFFLCHALKFLKTLNVFTLVVDSVYDGCDNSSTHDLPSSLA